MLKTNGRSLPHIERSWMFDLNQLRCFVVVAEELHFGRAAVRLNMTQPPLSRQIQVLEHITGVKLLERTSRVVRLTAAGRSFLPEARRILKLSDSATRVAQRIASGKMGSIKIGFTAAASYSFLPHLVKLCRTILPEVDLSLREMVSAEQLEALGSGQIDIGLLRPPVARPGYQAVRVAKETLMAAVPEGHHLLRKGEITLADFDDEPFIMYSPYESRYFHDLLATQFNKAEILPRYVQHLGQIHSVLSLVRAGLGVGIVPQAAASLNFAGVTLCELPVDPPEPVELLMVWRKDSENPLLPRFSDIAQSLAADLA
jgi:DNA-binding transcriptional LysR family regulator